MTQTLISLLNIIFGLLGANILALAYKKYSLGFTGNTISGVFGSVLFVKSFSRLGLSIPLSGDMDLTLIIVNFLLSFLAGAFGLFLIYFIKMKLNN
jgi:hypothetical protein